MLFMATQTHTPEGCPLMVKAAHLFTKLITKK
jgi:hypothetical protein